VENVSKTFENPVDQQWARSAPSRKDVELLKETVDLLVRLPTEVKLTRLAVRFPRIANRIADSWSRPDVLKAYLNGLLIDERGGRQGFPPEIVAELFKLSRYYETQVFPTEDEVAKTDIWDV
jgi:hypothetical protein